MDTVIALPTHDRRTSHAFYSALGLEAAGELAADGLPEPLQFRLNPGTTLMLIPRTGFGWVVGSNTVAEPGTSECLFSLIGDVDDWVSRARGAGAEIVAEPARQPWGQYAGSFADPDGHLWLIVAEPIGAE
jgi:predicted lactoylglutathione lyase